MTKMIVHQAVKLPRATAAYLLPHREHYVIEFRVSAQSTQGFDTDELNVKLLKSRIEISGNEELVG